MTKFNAVGIVAILVLLACSDRSVQAESGAVPIRIADGTMSRCIDPRKDRIWVTLRRLIVDKSKGFLKKEKSVALILNASVKVQPATAKPISFPLISEATLRGYSDGQVSVPIEYAIVDGLLLSQDNALYTGTSIEMTILNKKGRTGWGKALQALSETADKLPIPSNPITQTGSYLLEFANSAVSKDIEDQNSDDKAKSATLALNFDPTGQCAGGDESDFESTGTLAVLQQSGVQGPGYVPINRTNEYCWDADLRPAFILKAAIKEAGKACDDPSYSPIYVQVTNNYVAFFVNAVATSNVLGTVPEEDRQAALRRCDANGISGGDCF